MQNKPLGSKNARSGVAMCVISWNVNEGGSGAIGSNQVKEIIKRTISGFNITIKPREKGLRRKGRASGGGG